ncbi:MAG: hypothetical protein ACYTG1_04410 [Planctomycetota bacterium]|jgi:hypothetical protein
MADRVRKVNYCYVTVPRRAGSGAKVLTEIKDAGISMLGFTGFPAKAGQAQLDLIVDSVAPVRRLARQNGWRLSQPKKAFLVQGDDRAGAVQRHLQKLADERINVTAADATAAGKGRFGMMLWVKPKDYTRAARVLNAK